MVSLCLTFSCAASDLFGTVLFIVRYQIMSDDLATLQQKNSRKTKSPINYSYRVIALKEYGSGSGNDHQCHKRNSRFGSKKYDKSRIFNSLLECDEPALVIECLNGYRLKRKPLNYGEFKTPIGVVETMKEGADITFLWFNIKIN
jgi:hypothetical protein